jgi:glycosyltransferase involved in cell wall biosynthesis
VTPGGGPVVLDVQAIQSADHRGRGIARWSYEFAAAMVATRPDLLGRILLNPALPPPGDIEPLVASGLVAYAGSDGAIPPGAHVYHCLSPFELQVPLEQLWPREAARRGLLLALTAYDLIPLELSSHYLREAGARRRYRTRVGFLRAADAVLAISRAAAGQVRDLAGVDERRIAVVGTGISAHFRPPGSRARAGAAARVAVPGLEQHFVLCPAGTDYRKNIEAVIRAYAELEEPLRAAFQLVVSCEMTDQPRAHFEWVARALGIADRVLLTGFVSDEALLCLYQATDLVVFPSLSEGFGLPLAEALACGAPAIGSDIPAIAELVGPEQRFDPTDVGAIAAALRHALTDEPWRTALPGRSGYRPGTWHEVAKQAAGAYERLLGRPLHSWRRHPTMAFVTPLPPAPTGIAHHSLRLAEEVAATGRVDLDVFADSLDREPYVPTPPAGVPTFPAAMMGSIGGLRGGYDHVVYALGNSDNHVGALKLLRRHKGVVICHDVRLTNLYYFGAKDAEAVPGGFRAALRRMYEGALPEHVGESGRLSQAEEEQYGVLMAREVMDLCERFLVSSTAAAALAAVDAGLDPESVAKIALLPFAAERPVASRGGFDDLDDDGGPLPDGEGPLVVALGIVHLIRQPFKLLEAFAAAVRAGEPAARLAYVGPVPQELRDELTTRAAELGVAGSVILTGQVGTARYLEWMERATLAVQLRAQWNGEASLTVGECMVAGVPLIVSDLGWVRDLPPDSVARIAPDATPLELAQLLGDLLGSADRRRALAEAGLAHAPALRYSSAAEVLLSYLLGPERSSGSPAPSPA